MSSSKSAEAAPEPIDPKRDLAIVAAMRKGVKKKQWRKIVKQAHTVVRSAFGKKSYRLLTKLVTHTGDGDISIVGLSLQIGRVAAASGAPPEVAEGLAAMEKFAARTIQ